MSVVSHGIDIVQCERVKRVWKEHGDYFLRRVFTEAERAYCLDCRTPAERLSGRFAAKESVLKALGTGWRGGIRWTDIEILPDPLGRPQVTLTGKSAELAARLGIGQVLISISHTRECAVASAIAVSGNAG
ncbi:MAG TPA: holo-ACP synthase [Phycisphaerae bacterium]|nr:holo-ACP synthase [Phycisphaerae bacterium]